MNIETIRKADFRAHPGFADYLACMLQALQLSEDDEACSDGREARDTGTIYTLPNAVYAASLADWSGFATDYAADIAAAIEVESGEPGLRYANGRYMTAERIGSTLWLARSGTGVGFTDAGDAQCLQNLDAAADAMAMVEPYIGDDGAVYLS